MQGRGSAHERDRYGRSDHGGRRIGQVVARELAARGADIALAYRGSRTEAEQSASDVRKLGRRAATVQADVSRAADCERLIAETVAQLGRLDVLINKASVYGAEPFETLTGDLWDRSLRVNLTSAFLCARAAVPAMRRNGGGRIISFADWLARSGRPTTGSRHITWPRQA